MPRGVYNRKPVVTKKDPQPEATPMSSRLDMLRLALNGLNFNYTVFFTDEHGNTSVFGQIVKQQKEY